MSNIADKVQALITLIKSDANLWSNDEAERQSITYEGFRSIRNNSNASDILETDMPLLIIRPSQSNTTSLGTGGCAVSDFELLVRVEDLLGETDEEVYSATSKIADMLTDVLDLCNTDPINQSIIHTEDYERSIPVHVAYCFVRRS